MVEVLLLQMQRGAMHRGWVRSMFATNLKRAEWLRRLMRRRIVNPLFARLVFVYA